MNRALMLQTISIVIGVIRLTAGKNEKSTFLICPYHDI